MSPRSFLLAAIAATLSLTTPAQAGGLDPTFARGGLQILADGKEAPSRLAGLLRMPDGSFLAAVEHGEAGDVFARWSPRGVRLADRPLQGTNPYVEPEAMLALGDRLLLAGAGFRYGPAPPGACCGERVDGIGAAAFGADGRRLVGFGGEGGEGLLLDVPELTFEKATALAVAPNGDVVLGAHGMAGRTARLVLVRVDAGGRLVRSFGDGGVVVEELPGTREGEGAGNRTRWERVFVEPDGSILAVGTAVARADHRAVTVVSRRLPDGRRDPAFAGGRGYVLLRYAPGRSSTGATGALVGSGADRALVVAGGVNAGGWKFGLARLRLDGRLDPTFGRDGRVVTDLAQDAMAAELAVEPGGGLVVAGETQRSEPSISLARYRASGRLDSRFGAAGRACTRLGEYGEADVRLVREPDGRLVVAAVLNDSRVHLAIARYRARFAAGVECARARAHRGGAVVEAVFGRGGRIGIAVRRLDSRCESPGRRLGTVRLGTRPPGGRALRWTGRIAGRRLGRGCYELTPVELDRRGRVVERFAPVSLRRGG